MLLKKLGVTIYWILYSPMQRNTFLFIRNTYTDQSYIQDMNSMDVNTPRELIVGTDLEDIQKEPLVFTSKGHRLKLKPFMNGALGRVYLVHQYRGIRQSKL